MAKLKARGRREIVRYERDKEAPEPQVDIVHEKLTKAIMSDNRLLEKRVVWFKPGPYDKGKPVRHDYGWKVRGKIRSDDGKLEERIRYLCELWEKAGFTKLVDLIPEMRED